MNNETETLREKPSIQFRLRAFMLTLTKEQKESEIGIILMDAADELERIEFDREKEQYQKQ